MKKVLITIISIYFLIGFVMAMYSWGRELKTFRCLAPHEPHGYITMGTNSFINPNSEICTRRGFTLQSIINTGTLTVLGTPMIIMRIYSNLIIK